MRKLRIEIDETEDKIVSFAMPINDFDKSETIGFLSQLMFQLNYQLVNAAKKELRKRKTTKTNQP